jgi:hypothetical protein
LWRQCLKTCLLFTIWQTLQLRQFCTLDLQEVELE